MGTDFNDLSEWVKRMVEEREWQRYHTPKNIAMAIAVEAAELMEIYQFQDQTLPSKENIDKSGLELADVIIYCISMANCLGIKLEDYIEEKQKIFEKRHPASLVKGKPYVKYSERIRKK